MVASLIDGIAVARDILDTAAERAQEFAIASGRRPCLATVLVGDDPASHTYVRMKVNRCAQIGVESRRHDLPSHASTGDALAVVQALSADPSVDGILVQHPTPPHVDERALFEAIAPAKDVDGVTIASLGRMALGLPGFLSCTPGGILHLLDAYDIDVRSMTAVVVGRSAILGKPMGLLLLQRDATVTYCHSHTADLPEIVADADLIVAAIGRPEFIRGEWIKPDAVVIDAGYNVGNVGDVEFATALKRASFITPVPGGVGPTTIAVLLEQTVNAAIATVR